MSTNIRMSESERAPRSAAPTFDAAARAEREPYQNPSCPSASTPPKFVYFLQLLYYLYPFYNYFTFLLSNPACTNLLIINRFKEMKNPIIPLLVAASTLSYGTSTALAATTVNFFNPSEISTWTTSSQFQYYGNSTSATINLGGVNGSAVKSYTISPLATNNMVQIVNANGSSSTNVVGASQAESKFGLSSGSLSNVAWSGSAFHSYPTDYGYMTKEVNFSAGTYQFSWAYGAQDYQPYNDGAIFSLTGNGVQILKYLAVNGASNGLNYPLPTGSAFSDTIVLGSYGFADWRTTTFTIDTSGTYRFSLATYNAGDTLYPTRLFVSGLTGTITGSDRVNIGGPAVPEPSTYGLIGIGALGVAFAARRRKQKAA